MTRITIHTLAAVIVRIMRRYKVNLTWDMWNRDLWKAVQEEELDEPVGYELIER